MMARAFRLSDYEDTSLWYAGRGLSPVPLSCLPKTGMIEPGVCAIFLYKTDSQVGLIESLIVNPEASKEVTSEAIEECVRALEAQAQSLGLSTLICMTHIPGVKERAEKLGFSAERRRYQLLTKRIA